MDSTLVIEGGICPPSPSDSRRFLFALISLNEGTAGSVEVPFRLLCQLSLAQTEPVISVGRLSSNTLRVEDRRVSSKHFQIQAKRSSKQLHVYSCELLDLSTNGTLVNNKVLGKGKTIALRSGDLIEVLPASTVSPGEQISFIFRNNTEALSGQLEVPGSLDPAAAQFADALEQEVTCSICTDILYNAVALFPCLHNFCGGCFSEWMSRSHICPVCNTEFSSVVKNRALSSVVETFLKAHECRRRPAKELAELDAKDTLKGDAYVRSKVAVAPPGGVPEASPPPPTESPRPTSTEDVVIRERRESTACCIS
mmetsp:Transcript_69964/g.186424  ORF Transcript_69964/g.186424 Transcript_69964/m.186424 type:complete len:311 (+) Transcript_69964:109-1041(+)